MWGGFMEKAKTMAANLDQQINESVGMEDSVGAAASTEGQNPKPDDNAWNDDFDFGDDDANVNVTNLAAEPDASLAPKQTAAAIGSQPMTVPVPVPVPTPKTKSEPEPPVQSSEPRTQPAGNTNHQSIEIKKNLDPLPLPGQHSAFPEIAKTATVPAIETQGATKSDIPARQPAEQVQKQAHTAFPANINANAATGGMEAAGEDLVTTTADNDNKDGMVDDGWDQDDGGLGGGSMEEVEDAKLHPGAPPPTLEPPTPTDTGDGEIETPVSKEAAAATQGESTEPKAETSVGQTREEKPDNHSTPEPVKDIEMEQSDEAPKTSSSSGFASMLSPSVGSLSFGSPRANLLSPSPAPTRGKEQTPRSSNVTSLFSSLASAVDSALDSAVDQAPATPAIDVVPEQGDDGAWDDGDFDFPDDQSLPKEKKVSQTGEMEPMEQKETFFSKDETIEPPKDTPFGLDEKDTVLPPVTNGQSAQVQVPIVEEESTAPDDSIDHGTPVEGNIEDDPRYKRLQNELRQREQQLTNKSVQLTELQSLWELQEQELRQKIQDTKDEAKKRIQKAKERCEAAEARLKQNASHGAQTSAQQDQLINDLRSEGEVLMRKQSQMEQAVRNANGEARQLRSKLADETAMKEKAMEKVEKLEAELKETKEALKSAQKGESQAGKLENDLLAARSDSEMKAGTILSLQQKVKELVAEGKDLKKEMEKSKKNAAQDALQERKTLRREHNDTIADLETKLRTTEREAGLREDALRHEVSELRKRWEDAVRRADALSMDVQSSTAPLLRQLESMERQNRARAAAWAELENRLRSELEETVVQNETLSRERSEFKTKYTRLERSAHERDSELKESRRTIEDQTAKLETLEGQVETLVAEAEKREEEYQKVERLANEGVMRVRSEMTQTVVDSEERYRGQIEKLEADLRVEKEKRDQLQNQVEGLLENTGIVSIPIAQAPKPESKPKKLRQAEGQAEILAGALGFDDSDDETDDGIVSAGMDRGDGPRSGGVGSFAALEQLTSRLKASQVELESLRSNLRESERSRESLVNELAECRNAKEKLPLFEDKVKTLTEENREMDLELRGLRDDIADVRELYRTQLNMLLEEKTSHLQPESTSPAGPDESVGKDESEAVVSA